MVRCSLARCSLLVGALLACWPTPTTAGPSVFPSYYHGNVVLSGTTTLADLQALIGVTVLPGSLTLVATPSDNICYANITNLTSNLITAFASLREIRGSLSLGDPFCLPDFRFLRNVALIRGLSRVEPVNAALFISLTGATGGIRQLWLSSLTTVLGPIQLSGSMGLLCGKGTSALTQGVNFTSLVPGNVISDTITSSNRTVLINLLGAGQETVSIVYNFDSSSCPASFCAPACNGLCWGNDTSVCQKVCSPSCGRRGCRDMSPATCCDISCQFGCAADGSCDACADGYSMLPNGTCVQSCPSPLLPVGVKRVPVGGLCAGVTPLVVRLDFDPTDCVAACPLDTYLFNNTCVRNCPDGNKPVNGTCPVGLPPRGTLCAGIDRVSSLCEAAMVAAQQCDVLVGSVVIDRTSAGLATAADTVVNLSSLRVVTGHVLVRETPFISLSGLSSIVSVGGSPPDPSERATMNIQRNNLLASLGLTRLQQLGGNRLVIRDNAALCLQTTVPWGPFFTDTSSPTLVFALTAAYINTSTILNRFESIAETGQVTYYISRGLPSLFACSYVTCPTLCGARGCWSASLSDCVRCPLGLLLRDGECVPSCDFNTTKAYFQSNLVTGGLSDPYGCLPCYEGAAGDSCAACRGQSAFECTACRPGSLLRLDGSCRSTCPNTVPPQFPTAAATCALCDSNCRTCQGSNTTCTACSSLRDLYLFNGNASCLATCPRGFFRQVSTRSCAPCNATCGACTGPDSCTACDAPRYFEFHRCGLTCSANTYPENSTRACTTCNIACIGCSGPTSFNCTQCNLPAQYYRVPNTRECVLPSNCPPGSFANATTGQCEPCAANCTTCTNSLTCIACRAPALLTAAGLCVAVSVCPVENYQLQPPTQTAPITCAPLSVCRPLTQYARVAPTATSDRECADVSSCSNSTQFIGSPATATTDTVCAPCTFCNSSFQFTTNITCNGRVNTQCGTIDRCSPYPCLRNAPCVNNGGLSYTCVCPSPYTGLNCELDPTVCQPNPCNNGTCQPLPNSTFACTCPVNISGQRCSIDPRVCDVNPCLNNGTCVPAAGFRATCDCIPGYGGELCGELTASASASSFTVATFVGIAGGAVGFLLVLLVLAIVLVRRRARAAAANKANLKRDYLTLRKADIDEWELDRTLLHLGKVIGAGQFGQVSRALYEHPDRAGPALDVAVKLLKPGAQGTNDEKDFFAEMRMMKQIGRHKHVLSLVGVCTLEDPVMLVLEFAEHGDLRGYLRERRPTPNHPAAVGAEEFVQYSFQIACGMEFLAELKIVHRDLAARNVLVAKGPLLKVADFGLARDVVEDNVYIKSSEGKVPFKWMAPEALNDRIFTTQSDVWAFGITMWEITSFGATPYPGYENGDMFDLLESGYRMVPPDDCPDALYKVMSSCWHVRPEDRPSFTRLREALAILGNIPEAYMNEVKLQRYTLAPKKDRAPQAGSDYAAPDATRDYLIPGLPAFATIHENAPPDYVAPRDSFVGGGGGGGEYDRPEGNGYELPVPAGARDYRAGGGEAGYAYDNAHGGDKAVAVNPLAQDYAMAVDFTPPGVLADTDFSGPAYSLAVASDPLNRTTAAAAGDRLSSIENPSYARR